ncbi:hypothetical protein BJX63DRAFT_385725 [Aspergillus granulosus]|uniref:Uncharacterized protein n=1 Tax=Aspergillus granulosus TaxID=176169 RepID=A0ABR4HPJ4_9EURO
MLQQDLVRYQKSPAPYRYQCLVLQAVLALFMALVKVLENKTVMKILESLLEGLPIRAECVSVNTFMGELWSDKSAWHQGCDTFMERGLILMAFVLSNF